jgi:PhzF family phenazine biosynthesis protein
MNVEIVIVNAFIDGDAGGNPAGVVLNAEHFSRDQKQRIAAAAGLSETAFVSPSAIADFKLEFFTPTRQIPHCGHATIATFGYLRQIGLLRRDRTSKETVDGRREIIMEGDHAYMEQLAPRYVDLGPDDRRRTLDSLGVVPSDLMPGAAPLVVNTGNGFLMVPLRGQTAVHAVQPDMRGIADVSEAYDLVGYYVFSRETVKGGRDAGARMFAPRYGIAEEAATGMAAGPLACYLHDCLKNAKNRYVIEQGRLMSPPSPSVIVVKLNKENGAISSLMAGGKAAVREVRQVEV